MSSTTQFNNNKVSTFTNYQQIMGYKPVIKVIERYQVIKHIYKWIKLLDNDILNLIPKRIFYINVVEDDYQIEPNWKAACYLESFIYSIAILKMKDITFTYPTRDTPTIFNVNIECSRISRVDVIGANGAGKSTAIKILIG